MLAKLLAKNCSRERGPQEAKLPLNTTIKKQIFLTRLRQANQLAEKYGWICWYCQVPITLKTCEIDHIVPVVRGGKNHISNYALACVQCNRGKHTMSLRDFWTWLKRPKQLVEELVGRLEILEEQHEYVEDFKKGLRVPDKRVW